MELLWKIAASVISRPAVWKWLYRHGTPYFDIYDTNADGTRSLYMHRQWVFNPYESRAREKGARFNWLPSARIHHIRRADLERHKHNHPWPARTIILKGWYLEEREFGSYFRREGSTAPINADTFHRITEVSPGGVWTLFITWDWVQVWSFRTPERDVPWREYLGIEEGGEG